MAFAMVTTASAQNVSTSVQKKHVLIEDFTGIHCGNCPDADVYQERLILAQQGNVNVICVHAGSYATAGIGEPNYITPVSTEIHNQFKISSYPSALVNRTEIAGIGKIIGRSNLAACSRMEASNDALVNVWVSSKFDNTTGKIIADVELYYTGEITDGSSALCVSLLQNKMYGQQSGGGANADEYEHNHVLRAMLTPTWGDTIATSGKGTLVKRHYEYRLPTVIGTESTDPLHSDIIAYVINNETREVYNSQLCHVSCEGMECEMNAILEPYKIEPQRNFGFNFFDCYLINDGNDPITSANFNVTLNDSVMQSVWTGSIAPQERGYIRIPVDFSKQYKGSNEYAVKLTGINGKDYNGGTLKGEFSELITVNDTIIVKLKTDNFVGDNTFRILDANGNVVKELGPYKADAVANDTIVLPGKGFYCYEVVDAWGDGITRPRGYIYWYNSLGKQVAANSDVAFHGYRIFFNYGDELPEAPEKPVDPVNPGGDDDPITPIIPDDPNDPELKGSLWGQDGEFGLKVMPTGTNQYATEMKMGADGTLWWFVYNPASTAEADIRTTTYNMYLQGVDKFGNKKFNGIGKLISNYPNRSWTEVTQYLCCNSDSSVTVCIRDCRNTGAQGDLSFTGYRFRADGTSMWPEDGVCLDEGANFDVACCVTICELTNGDNVFAWMRSSAYTGQPFYIERCRVTKDGVKADKLDDTRIGTSTTFYQYPYLVASDDNSYILIYGLTNSLNLYAKKYDLNHKELWNVGTRGLKIYAGGWGSVNALQTRMKVQSDGEGGALIAWNDDRNGDGYYAAYLCWIKPDGSYGFTNEDGGHDIRFTYTEMSQSAPDVIRTTDGKGFIAILDEFAQGSQSWQDLVIQKIDNEGNRPWGDDGIFIEDLQNVESISYTNIEPGNPGQFIIAYQKYRSVFDVTNYYGILSEKDGSIILGDTIIEMSPVGHDRSKMELVSNPEEKYWIMHWRDGGADKEHKAETHCLARVNFSGNIINWMYNPEPEYTPGDANFDGAIDVGDYTVVANHILANESPAVADANKDGEVNVGDLTAIANIILYGEGAASAKPRFATDPTAFDDLIYIKDATATAGSEIEIPVYMKNSVPMTGFQFDVVMPEGLSIAMDDEYYLIDLSTVRTTARKTNTFDSAAQKDGSVRVLAGSTKSETFSGTDGEVAIITANVAAGLADGEYKVVLKNIIMSDKTGQTYKVDSSEAIITVGSATGINTIDTKAVRNGKYLQNGNIVIVNNGKQFNVVGTTVK